MIALACQAVGRLAASVFADKLESDSRLPFFIFSLPLFVGKEFGIVGVVFQFWFQMFCLSFLHMLINMLTAYLAYKFILKKKQSATALLVGFGIIIPLLVYLPFRMIEVFDLRNPVLKLSAVSGPALHIFRCLETLYDTVPSFATKSLSSFMWYFGATVEFNVDAGTQQVTRTSNQEIRSKCATLVVLFLQCVALYTMLVPYNYKLFPQRQITRVSDVFFWGNLCNNYMMGALTKTTVEFGMSVLGLLVSLCSGFSTANINIYPLTATSSPSDFWGRRWNTLVAGGLKRGIYMPCRKQGLSKPVAALATFVASGILHEYYLYATAFGGRSLSADQSTEIHLIGSHLLFFLWNAVVLILEGLLQGNALIGMMNKSLPTVVYSFCGRFLSLMLILPLVHFFTDQFSTLLRLPCLRFIVSFF
jgi:hypothetical protein